MGLAPKAFHVFSQPGFFLGRQAQPGPLQSPPGGHAGAQSGGSHAPRGSWADRKAVEAAILVVSGGKPESTKRLDSVGRT